jgi:hypothetical protein
MDLCEEGQESYLDSGFGAILCLDNVHNGAVD